jgi:predicted MFS family arabinose efflux permease
MRALVGFVSALLALEAALWSSLAPVLPRYADKAALSQLGAGVVTAAYTAGLVVSAAVLLFVAPAIRARVTIALGLAVLAAATAWVGFANSAATLTAARAFQGGAAGCVWVAGLAWLTTATPKATRGRSIGTVFAANTLGTVLGPALGTLALAVGTAAAFIGVAVATAALIPWGIAIRAARVQLPRSRLRLGTFRQQRMHVPLWFVVAPSLPLGLALALVPLRLRHLGMSAGAVAVTFLMASGVAVVTTYVSGRLSDHYGRLPIVLVGVLGSCPCLVTLGITSSARVAAGLVVLFVGVLYSFALPAAIAFLTDRADGGGIAPAVPALTLTVTALAETIGALGGSGLAEAFGFRAPFVAFGALTLGTLALVARAARSRARLADTHRAV